MPGSSVSLVARKYGISSSLLFRWRQLKESGGVSGLQAVKAVVPESEVQALKAQVRELQRLLGKKTQEAEILREVARWERVRNKERAQVRWRFTVQSARTKLGRAYPWAQAAAAAA